jgi:hypothetical protein
MRLMARMAPGFALALLVIAGCGGDDDGGPDGEVPDDILEFLESIPGMTAVEEPLDGDTDYRFFRLEYEQPADHDDPEGVTFRQRMTLLHIDRDAPVVLHTSGYYAYDQAFAAEVTALLGGNQLHVEQRFFEPSRPEPADWSLLTIAQAAADHHRIVEAMAPYYGGAWVSTGASKGGMTSVFHRRFYPDDVAATVAYVAPISHGAPDDSYQPFFDSVGTESCRTALEDYQRELLTRRAAMVDRMEAFGAASGITFDRSAGAAGAFEDSVVEFPWGFWQYADAAYCDAIPPTSATDGELWDFHVELGELDYYGDQEIEAYEPYFYQADAELGYPSMPTAHIDDLLETQDLERDYLPAGVTVTYDPEAMDDVDAWVRGEGERLLFVYGGNDPWSAGAFDLGDAADSFLFVAPGLNHSASIADLVADDQATALDALERWTGVAPRALSARRAAAAAALPPEPPPRRLRPR